MIVHLNFPPALNRPPIEMKRSVMLLGRHPECDVRLKVASVSRRHCCLAQVNDDVLVRDLGSRHGVWVNGRKVEETILKPGDELAIGTVIFTIATNEPVDPTPPVGSSVDEVLVDVEQTPPSFSVSPQPVAAQADDELMDLDAPSSVDEEDEAGDESDAQLLDDSGVGPGLGLKL